jgi:DNA-binding GntR family transcriptional regulator
MDGKWIPWHAVGMTSGITNGLSGGQPPTRTEWADQRLREAILQGEFVPGEPLVISALAEQLGLSATPLREALRKLASEGLVVLQSHGSARVAEVDLHEANEIYELRLLLEPLAVERSVAKGGAEFRQRVEDTWNALTAQRIASPSAHAAFHRALLSECDSAWLSRVATMLADRAGLMVTVGLPARPADYDTSRVHRRLMELAVAGDGPGAAEELRRHLTATLTALHIVLRGSQG